MGKYKQGLYRIVNEDKFIEPIDNTMQSHNKKGYVEYKSSYELQAFRFMDANPHIKKWSAEPFAIKYIKPTDNQPHRYYIDLFIEFNNGKKFLVEIKPSSETKPPKPPKKQTQKAHNNYMKALETFEINKAKWKFAKEFAKSKNMEFIILTEKELF